MTAAIAMFNTSITFHKNRIQRLSTFSIFYMRCHFLLGSLLKENVPVLMDI